MTGRDALLSAFDRLFDTAMEKLHATCSDAERADAREQFVSRFATALEVTREIPSEALPDDVLLDMQGALTQLTTAELAGVIASIPLAQQTQDMLRAVAVRQAQQKMLEHLALQADTRWGGN